MTTFSFLWDWCFRHLQRSILTALFLLCAVLPGKNQGIKESRNQGINDERRDERVRVRSFAFLPRERLQNVSVEMIRMFILVPNSSDQKSSDSGKKRWDVGRWWPVLGVVTGGFILSRRPLATLNLNPEYPRTPNHRVPSRTDNNLKFLTLLKTHI